MILFVTLKETYFLYEGIFPVSMLDLQLHNIQTNQLLSVILEGIYI